MITAEKARANGTKNKSTKIQLQSIHKIIKKVSKSGCGRIICGKTIKSFPYGYIKITDEAINELPKYGYKIKNESNASTFHIIWDKEMERIDNGTT